MQKSPAVCQIKRGSLLGAIVDHHRIVLPAGGNGDVARGCGILNAFPDNNAMREQYKTNEYVQAALEWIDDGMPQPSGVSAPTPRGSMSEELEAQARTLDAEKKKNRKLEKKFEQQAGEISEMRSLIDKLVPADTPSGKGKRSRD